MSKNSGLCSNHSFFRLLGYQDFCRECLNNDDHISNTFVTKIDGSDHDDSYKYTFNGADQN